MSFSQAPPGDVEAEIDKLYQLPLADFTQARNSLAARLRPQDPEAAARVKSLPRPSASAWAVNQVFWTARREFDALIDAGDLLRALQAAGASASELRDAMRERRLALSAALRKAEARLGDHSHSVGTAIQQRVAASLEALGFYGSARPAEILPGRLTQDLSPPGFDALAELPAPVLAAPDASGGLLRVDALGGGRADDEERARAELARLGDEVSAKRRQAQTARSAAEEAARRAEGARSEQVEAERRLTRAALRARESTAAAEQAQAVAAQAEAELAAAEAALQARRSLSS